MSQQLKSNAQKYAEKMSVGAAFTLFILIACYKITNSSLWFDETIEYWYSKVMFGTLPFSQTTNMYQRVVSTLQPPLYNFLMYFWLKISDTEWWFRLFGVVMGFLGMIGLFHTLKKRNVFLAAGAVCFSACVYRLVYYWQEAAEYCLMLGALFWTVYFWIRLIENPNLKNIIGFIICAILPVYSQYGAAFPVLAMGLTSFIITLLTKNKRTIIEISIAYIFALIVAAIPLYVLFLKKQISLQHGGANVRDISFGIKDCFDSLHSVFRWNFFSNYITLSSKILLILILMISIVVLIKGTRTARIFILMNILTWFFYYFAVKMGVYADMSYGGFGNRYNLFFIPLWISSLFYNLHEFYLILTGLYLPERVIEKLKILRNVNIKRDICPICAGIALCFLVCYCCSEWTGKLQYNWNKEDIRGTVYAWYQQNAAEKNTIVYYAADSGFAYYVRMNPGYNGQTEDRVTYMTWYADKTGEEYRKYLNDIYGNTWPKEVYIVVSHGREDVRTLTKEFVTDGYVYEDIYNPDPDNPEGGRLIKLTKS